jgi:hypothetical protein
MKTLGVTGGTLEVDETSLDLTTIEWELSADPKIICIEREREMVACGN